MKITREMINELKTARGGFLSKVMKLLGVEFPLKKGWPKRIIGKEISAYTLVLILEANEKHDKKLSKKLKIKPTVNPSVEPEDVPWWSDNSEWFLRKLEPGKLPWE